jgi:hypothetical protein
LVAVATLVLEGTRVGEALAVEFRGNEGCDREGEEENESNEGMLEMHSCWWWCCMKRLNVLNLGSKARGVVFPTEVKGVKDNNHSE